MPKELPQDNFILLSLINTALRDGEDKDDFCAEYGCSFDEICGRMQAIGYFFDSATNSFR